MERPRRQQRQPVHLQDCEVNLDDEVDDNGDLVHFVFFADSEPVRLVDAIQHPKWQEAMNEEMMVIEKNNIMTQISFNLDVPNKTLQKIMYVVTVLIWRFYKLSQLSV